MKYNTSSKKLSVVLQAHTNLPSEYAPWPFSVSKFQSYVTLCVWQKEQHLACPIRPLGLNEFHCIIRLTAFIYTLLDYAGLLATAEQSAALHINMRIKITDFCCEVDIAVVLPKNARLS